MRRVLFMACIAAAILGQAAFAAEPVYTPTWMTVYGAITYNGASVDKGDEVRAYTADGILVGKFPVEKEAAGQYGFMPLYGDDVYSPAKDGASAGDAIRFVLFRVCDGQEHAVVHQSVEPLSFAAGGEEIRLDLMY